MRVLSGFTSVGREGRALSVRAPADRGYRTRGTHHHPHAQALGRYSTTARHTQYTACIHRAHTCTVTGARRAPRLLWAARLARCAGCAGLRALGAAATRAKGPGRRQPQRARPPRRARRAAARRARPPRHAAGLPPPPREAAAARGRCRSRTWTEQLNISSVPHTTTQWCNLALVQGQGACCCLLVKSDDSRSSELALVHRGLNLWNKNACVTFLFPFLLAD